MESYPDTSLLYAAATSTTPCISAAVTITASTALLRQETAHFRIRYPMLSPTSAAVYLVTAFDLIRLMIFDLIRLDWGFDLIRLTCGFELTRRTFFNLIRLTFNVFIFDPSHAILIKLQSYFRESHIGQGVFEIFQH